MASVCSFLTDLAYSSAVWPRLSTYSGSEPIYSRIWTHGMLFASAAFIRAVAPPVLTFNTRSRMSLVIVP